MVLLQARGGKLGRGRGRRVVYVEVSGPIKKWHIVQLCALWIHQVYCTRHRQGTAVHDHLCECSVRTLQRRIKSLRSSESCSAQHTTRQVPGTNAKPQMQEDPSQGPVCACKLQGCSQFLAMQMLFEMCVNIDTMDPMLSGEPPVFRISK